MPRRLSFTKAAMRSRARRWAARLVRDAECRAERSTHVRPCPECRSTQLCQPDCWVAPWNIEPLAEHVDP